MGSNTFEKARPLPSFAPSRPLWQEVDTSGDDFVTGMQNSRLNALNIALKERMNPYIAQQQEEAAKAAKMKNFLTQQYGERETLQDLALKEEATRAAQMKNALSHKYGEQEILQDMALKKAHEQQYRASGQDKGIKNSLASWNALTPAQKNDVDASYRAFGADTQEVPTLVNKFNSPVEYALSKNVDPDEIEKKLASKNYLPTPADASALQKQRGVLASNHYLGEQAAEWIAPYAKEIAGKSVKYGWDYIVRHKASEDDRAKYIAAQMIGPELALSMIKLSGGSNAYESIKHSMAGYSLGKKIPDITKDEAVFKKAFGYAMEALRNDGEIQLQVSSGQDPESVLNSMGIEYHSAHKKKSEGYTRKNASLSNASPFNESQLSKIKSALGQNYKYIPGQKISAPNEAGQMEEKTIEDAFEAGWFG